MFRSFHPPVLAARYALRCGCAAVPPSPTTYGATGRVAGSPRHQAAPQRAPAAPTAAGPPDDVVPLATDKDRGRFLATLLMLESLHDKPYPVHGVADAKLKKEILADEDLMQEVLKLYETTQETKGQHFIKIPPRLMKKMKQKMTELLSE